MSKVKVSDQPWGQHISFFCPGCNHRHAVTVRTDEGRPSWSFNGDRERPTLTPSLLVNPGRQNPAAPQCHLFLTDGVLHFLPDCSHPLAGQSVPLEEEGGSMNASTPGPKPEDSDEGTPPTAAGPPTAPAPGASAGPEPIPGLASPEAAPAVPPAEGHPVVGPPPDPDVDAVLKDEFSVELAPPWITGPSSEVDLERPPRTFAFDNPNDPPLPAPAPLTVEAVPPAAGVQPTRAATVAPGEHVTYLIAHDAVGEFGKGQLVTRERLGDAAVISRLLEQGAIVPADLET